MVKNDRYYTYLMLIIPTAIEYLRFFRRVGQIIGSDELVKYKTAYHCKKINEIEYKKHSDKKYLDINRAKRYYADRIFFFESF